MISSSYMMSGGNDTENISKDEDNPQPVDYHQAQSSPKATTNPNQVTPASNQQNQTQKPMFTEEEVKKDLEEFDLWKKEQDERKEEGFRKMAEEIVLDSRHR